MPAMTEDELQELIFDTLDSSKHDNKPQSRARVRRSSTNEGAHRSPKPSAGPKFGRSKTTDSAPRRTKRTPNKAAKDTNAANNQLDPAMIIKRLEKLATSDDSQAEEFLQQVKGDVKEGSSSSISMNNNSSSMNNSGSGRRRSTRTSRSSIKAVKMLEKYGINSADGVEYLQYLTDSSGHTALDISSSHHSRKSARRASSSGIRA